MKRKKQASELARILSDRGKALYYRGKLPAAGARYDKAIAIYTRLVERECREDLANELAMTLLMRGNVLLHLRQQFPEVFSGVNMVAQPKSPVISLVGGQSGRRYTVQEFAKTNF